MENTFTYHQLLQLPTFTAHGTLCCPVSTTELCIRNELGMELEQSMRKRKVKLNPEKWISMTCVNYPQPKHLNFVQYVDFVFCALYPELNRKQILEKISHLAIKKQFPELASALIYMGDDIVADEDTAH